MLREDIANMILETRTDDNRRSMKEELQLADDIITLVREDTLHKVTLYARKDRQP
jgi:hypothetical protein